MEFCLKRAYEKPEGNDGIRVLVDRIWPRGLSKEELKLDAWSKDIAPSSELRKWFGHDPEKWDEFKRRYFRELDDCREAVDDLLAKVKKGRVTLVYAAHDEACNNAVALKAYLETRT